MSQFPLTKAIPRGFCILLPVLAGSIFSASAQSVSPAVVSSAGGRFVNSSVSLTWTLGEVSIESYSKNPILLTQGFHQPTITLVGVVEESNDYKDRIQIYPNPSTDYLTVKLPETSERYRIELRNMSGKQVYEGYSAGDQHRIDMDLMANGLYILSLYTESGSLAGSYKIQKQK